MSVRAKPKRDDTVTAFQWTGGPVEGFQLMRNNASPHGEQLLLPKPLYAKRYASHGDWILEDKDGFQIIQTDEEFKEHYEEVEE